MQEIVPFSTIIYRDSLFGINYNYMIDKITEMSKTLPSVARSNSGGWQSESSKERSELMSQIISEVDYRMNYVYTQYGIGAPNLSNYWINVNPKNTFNFAHNHPHSYFSAVLYLKTPENSGSISFDRPDMLQDYIVPVILNHNNSPLFKVTPEAGMLLIFPSFLKHSVDMNLNDEERISIAFNYN